MTEFKVSVPKIITCYLCKDIIAESIEDDTDPFVYTHVTKEGKIRRICKNCAWDDDLNLTKKTKIHYI